MLNIAIIDDDSELCQYIKKELNLIKRLDSIDYRITIFNSADTFLQSRISEYSILLLDIDMPGTNGLEAAEILRNKGVETIIIFITSKIKYMQDAFGLNVFGFIDKKQVSISLPDVLNKCLNYLENNIWLGFKTNDGPIKIKKDDIIYAEFEDRKVALYCKDNKYMVNLQSLNQFYDMVKNSEDFIYINRGDIINLRYLMSTSNKEAKLRGIEYTLPISKEKIHQVNCSLMDWISNKGII